MRSPYSGDLVNEMTRCSAADVDLAVAAAKAAQPAWAATPLIERVKVLRRINALFVERAEPIARVLVQEIGKTITESREEVHEYAAPAWQKAGEEVLRHRGLSFPSTQEQTNNKRLVMTHRPLGVVGAITPYNFPTDISSIALAHRRVASRARRRRFVVTGPVPVERVDDPSLPKGKTVVEQEGSAPTRTSATRKVFTGGELIHSETWTTSYEGEELRIVRVGTKAGPEEDEAGSRNTDSRSGSHSR